MPRGDFVVSFWSEGRQWADRDHCSSLSLLGEKMITKT